MEQLVPILALAGGVIIVASLLSGLIDRSGVPLVAAFLALGALLGPHALGLVDVGIASPPLTVLATLALTLVLFSDAVSLDFREVRRWRRLAWLLLGPGTLVVALLVAVAAWALLGLAPTAATLLGAALAATDPVLLRSAMRSRDLPDSARVALRLETGMNDVVVLPIVVFSVIFLGREGAGGLTAAGLAHHALGLLVLGPAAGAAVGALGILALKGMRARFGVRRDFESLYALGLAFTGYAAAEGLGGSGFLAAFAAGMMVSWQDVELCDCFLEYGEATAEMLLLLTFVALGLSLMWIGLPVLDLRTLAFAVIALATRTVVMLPLLTREGLPAGERRIIAFFGPRGLSSLLYVLLAAFAGVAGADRLFAVAAMVVLLSVVVHGGGMALLLRRLRAPAAAPAVSEGIVQAADAELPERITIEELQALRARGEAVTIVDARSDRSWHADDIQAAGAIRLAPDDPVRGAEALRLAHHGTVVVYCA
ncbi:MAG TPA: cation:proton antiporter [Gemmatimonadaceae bacterium]